MIRFHNNLTRKLEEFKPINEPFVTIYSCGPTVYDVSHIGHARSAITWDILARYLSYRGYKVKWARNITNIDDKIINRANELNISPDKLSRQYTYEFWHDMVSLNVCWPDFEPRATDFLPEMFNFIQGLIDNGSAYEVNGDVYFRVSKHSNYGQLKGLGLEDLRKGVSRIDENEKKEDALDFALWKAFPKDATMEGWGEVFESPWGWGRPGWHLECSTMIHSILGDTIDIHSGGDDLIFPHHENECAQSECLTNQALAKFWMHNGMIMINGKKMSKSENNYLTIKDILAKYSANAIRYFALSTHYKKQLNFTDEALKAAESGFENLYKNIKDSLGDLKTPTNSEDIKKDKGLNQDLISKFEEAMDEDMNTAKALALLFEYKDDKNKSTTIACLLEILGFDLIKHGSIEASAAHNKEEGALSAAMDLILEIRNEARANKDFTLSDKIRDKLNGKVQIKDFRDKPSEWSLN